MQQGFENIEALRQQLLKDEGLIKVEDLGAGSRVDQGQERKLSSIARHASTPPRFSRLLARLISRFQAQTVLELGTSLGLNTLHMAQANPMAQIYTLEGSSHIADLAQTHFRNLDAPNINLTLGNIDQTLETVLADLPQVDLLYMDANHRYEPTLRYFQQALPKLHQKSLVVIDDIHWSAQMNRAWREITARSEVSLSLDLFEAGILFFDTDLPKEHYILKY